MATRKEPFGEYIRNFYGLDLKKGEHVMCGDTKKRGVVVKCDHHVHVRLEGEKHDNPWHPSDIHKYDDGAKPHVDAINEMVEAMSDEDVAALPIRDGVKQSTLDAVKGFADRRDVLREKLKRGEITREEAHREFPESF